jgi:molybdopterin molybdotransferase
MIGVEEALSKVLAAARPKRPIRMPVADSLGLTLAEDITSDIDSPPHDKTLVDGYAVIADEVSGRDVELAVLEEVAAGAIPTIPVTRGTATRIMTGAPIPDGADAVVMIERTKLVEASADSPRVQISGGVVRSGQNIMTLGTSMRRGEVVLLAGTLIRPIEVGLFSEVGRAEIAVYPRPRVAVLATGNELVAPRDVPSAGQIRNSNGPMLGALVTSASAVAVDLGVGRDTQDELRGLIERGLREDVLVLSGGVSAGVLDLVPSVLAQLGVHEVFHKVNLKPGKPLWFGVLPSEDGDRLVFGLPGNPVSTLVCFELFVRPALDRLAGREVNLSRPLKARLTRDHQQRGDRPTYFPAAMSFVGHELVVQTVAWKGSADLRSLAEANCLAYFPPGDRLFAAGEVVNVHSFTRGFLLPPIR